MNLESIERIFILFLPLLLFGATGCSKQTAGNHYVWPDLGPAQKVEPGVRLHEVRIAPSGVSSKLWVYLPDTDSKESLPCVLIAPAGARLYDGKSLGTGDRPEHLPYVRAGFVVVAYEVDGDPKVEQGLVAAARAFKNADAGLKNARAALDFISAKLPIVDSNRIYAAGHSSAATLSLLVAENESRIKGCVAYAPVCDVVARIERLVDTLSSSIPGFREFIERSSPDRNAAKLTCPLFLFHADDDSVVATEGIVRFAEVVRRTNPNVTLARVTRGDHYDSMLDEGIPKAIEWLKGLSEKNK